MSVPLVPEPTDGVVPCVAALIDLLRAAGFTVEAGDRFGALRLPPGLIRYTAQK